MSRQTLSRSDRVAQMTKQEELIAKKRQEILEKQKTVELGKAVAAAQSSGNANVTKKKEPTTSESTTTAVTITTTTSVTAGIVPSEIMAKFQNNFCNDGSFLTHFKKILEETKKNEEAAAEKVEEKSEEPEVAESAETLAEAVVIQSPMPAQPQQIQQTSSHISLPPPPPPPPVTSHPPHIPVAPNPPFGNISQPLTNIPPYNAAPTPAFYNPCVPPIAAFTSITTPPPPPPPSTPLYLIPPPDPLQLNKIPPPKDLDLNAIPKPEMSLETIKVPNEYQHQLQQALPPLQVHHELQQKGFYSTWNRWLIKIINRDDDQNVLKHSSNDEKYDPESVIESHDDSDDEYMKDIMGKNLSNLKRKIEECKAESDGSGDEQKQDRNRKRRSRWGGKADAAETAITALVQTTFANQNKPILSVIQRTDPALLQYARKNYGSINLSEEDWRKCEDHFKINLLYQDMMRKRKEIDQLAKTGKFKYEYDSDEDTSGGTWEHKLRTAEMEATKAWADALTAQSEGKHHIGDFLPPEELKKFMEKYDAKKNNRTPDLSDYKEYKLTEDNIGFQMLQKLGWKEGQGLGASGTGIVDPVNKAPQRDANQGLGAGTPSAPEDCDNEYEAYRKRMMLAYRFRPNPLNNPRRAYY
ncbi:unnamed protein product [Hermetia illucens]|uniref:G-patch domain-containing protein n=1 Tax=Hermetia illucens TaxID=343691 RepID=A0A7R8V6K8_HERIL|nr:unnamed protein product [Hermetia illucens]